MNFTVKEYKNRLKKVQSDAKKELNFLFQDTKHKLSDRMMLSLFNSQCVIVM